MVSGFGQLDLWRLAGKSCYERGEQYLDAVADLRPVVDGVRATVYGTQPYDVLLSWADGALTGSCTCPHSIQGAFCKHCVAVGLSWIEDDEASLDAGPDDADDTDGADAADAIAATDVLTDDDLLDYLESLDHRTLVQLLYEATADNEALLRTLSLRAARDREKPDVATLRRQIDSVLNTYRYLDYDDAPNYAYQVNEIVQALADLLAGGHAAEVVPLAERVVAIVSEAMEQVDDSSGMVGGACQQAADLHAQACRAAPPDPTELARWLLRYRLDGDWPELPLASYAPALGAQGLTYYREQVKARWAALPRLGPGDTRASTHSRYSITRAMEELAKLDGVDALVGVLAADLSSTWQYTRIATALAQAGRTRDALTWAERGLDEHPRGWPDGQLVDITTQQLLELGEWPRAVDLRRRALENHRTFDYYRHLQQVAGPAGVWDEHREPARALLTGVELIQALLADDEIDLAWRAAQDVQCPDQLWLQLAHRRAEQHPLDAAGVLRRLAAASIERRNNQGYEQAANLISQVRKLHQQAGEPEAFRSYLAEIRSTHRQKRNFLTALTNHGL